MNTNRQGNAVSRNIFYTKPTIGPICTGAKSRDIKFYFAAGWLREKRVYFDTRWQLY